MTAPLIAFHCNLVQDVNTLRPLVRLAADLPADRWLLVSPTFSTVDKGGVWRTEIEALAAATGATVVAYETLFDAVRLLGGRSGLCIAGSESDVGAHRGSHDLFRALPSGLRGVTMQHGYECVGFLHNARHSAAYGRDTRFAADIVVGWFGADRLHDLPARERGKLYVAGPPMLIDRAAPGGAGAFDADRGMVCENTHSVRFSSRAMQAGFLDQMEALAARSHAVGRGIDFRPHPAAGFLARSGYALPPGMTVSDAPLYTLDLGRYAYAISAPSTILFDFVLADVPVALWGSVSVDVANYAGLLGVDGAEQCWRFANAAVAAREALLANQRRFLADLHLPDDVPGRYRALLALAFN